MQSAIVLLVALTGVGCHNKSCDTCYEPAVSVIGYGCYSGYTDACYTAYAPACYATAYSGCYGGGWGCYGRGWGDACYSMGDWSGSCYGGACYGGWSHGYKKRHRHGGLFGGFKRRRCDICNPQPVYASCYGGWWDSCYSQPVFGSYTPTYGSGQYGSSQYGAAQVVSPMTTEPVPGVEPAPEVPTPATEAPITPPSDAPAVPTAPAPGDVPTGAPPAPAPGGLPTEAPAVPAVPSPGDAIPPAARPGF
jgi:hypothetical protein